MLSKTDPASDTQFSDLAQDGDHPHSTFRKWATGLLLVVGVEFWLVLGKADYGKPGQWWALLGAVLICVIPFLANRISSGLDRIRHPSSSTRTRIAIAIWILSTGYLLFTARFQHRVLDLKYLDEHSYMIGARMAARGRLWMPSHPVGDFFEALELLTSPVYASAYFPGTAIVYAPSIWLRIPFWIWSALLAGASVGLTYRIVEELLDSIAGLLAALLLIASSIFRLLSMMMLSQTPALLLSLLAIYAWLRWRERHVWGWALLIGLFGGWCAITRPLDAVALLLPVGAAMLLESVYLCHRRPAHMSDLRTGRTPMTRAEHDAQLPKFTKSLVAIVVGASPFLLIQIIFNLGVTGSIWQSPFQLSQSRDYPQVTMGLHTFDPTIRPATALPQKIAQYDRFTVPQLKLHQPGNAAKEFLSSSIPDLLSHGLAAALLLIMLPCGWLLWNRGRWPMLISLPLWMAMYMLYPFELPHYIVPLLPVIALTIVCGVEQARSAWPKMNAALTTFLTLATLVLVISNLPEISPRVRDEFFRNGYSELAQIKQKINDPNLFKRPAVVLFANPPKLSGEVEPVYNTDVAWPDDAPVIRAHDLGEARDAEIFRYYAKLEPDRSFYRYDRARGSITFLGTAKDLGHD